ncbi:hypothetical protein [uncultured Lacinutrix sp.]|uniref:hypothetical protein n=1 Tax=uncultured Lacinutrix sp. TaxID=574032 RepID=UPI002602CF47|nr:hypothetical protein [uncultured Lacinutrix sp.]
MYFVGYVAYFELNIDYIIETYCVNKEKPQLQCNGKCHLAKQIATTTTTDNDGDATLNSLAESFFPVFYVDYNYDKDIKKSLKKDLRKNTLQEQLYSFSFEHIHFRPPIV